MAAACFRSNLSPRLLSFDSKVAQQRTVTFPTAASTRRLEPVQPGRVTAVAPANDSAFAVADKVPLEEELRKLVASPELDRNAGNLGQGDPLVNRAGLNGLATSGIDGLHSGVFQVTAAQPISYVVEEVEGLFNLDNEALLRGVVPGSFPCQLSAEAQPAAGQRRFIVIDENVHAIYGKRIQEYFDTKGMVCQMLPLPTREANKDFDLVFQVADALENFGINRRKEPIIAIGGGVCLDVTGLAANLYRRNTPVIKIPTTVMAAIDASIGIKTAVNFHEKKNKLGTYCAPLAVFIDRSFLRTLDQRNLSNGAAEMLKMACIKDAELFNMLETHGERFIFSGFQGPVAGAAMRRSIQGMLEELEYNLWEHILIRLVDYGHTFSPEIEMAALASGNELLHGEAVNIDMALTTQIAFGRGMITLDERNRVFRLMRSLQLPFWHPVCSPELFYKGLKDTTKARDGLQRMPLMNGIGQAKFVDNVTKLELMTAACVLHTVAKANTPVFEAVIAPEVISSVVPARDLHTPQPLAT